MKTHAVILNNYPHLTPNKKNVEWVSIELGGCSSNSVLVRLLFLSVDPYMRNRLRPEGTSYINRLEIGQPITSMGIAEVIESGTSQFKTEKTLPSYR